MYLDGYKQWKGSRELRIQIGKECFESWNIFEMLNQADVTIAKQKKLFKQNSISLKPSRDFNEYFMQVKNNIQMLTDLFLINIL